MIGAILVMISEKKPMRPLLIVVLFFYSGISFAQIENEPPVVQFEQVEDDFKTPDGLELPALKKPSLSDFDNLKDPNSIEDPLKKEEKVDFTQGDGLVDYTSNIVPKAFKKDKEPSEEYGRDQFLGDVKTSGGFVQIKYRDHEFVDGDRIRVLVNDDVVQSDISLGGAFGGFTLTLVEGYNRIEFLALNQGSSGPNTAELHVYNDKGQLISAAEWNLLTGNKATVVVIKE